MPKGQKGGAAPGERRGGRRKGTPNKVSKRERMRKECEASGMTPLEYMLKLLRDPVAPLEMRNWAANAAAPYVHPKLAAAVKADGTDLPTDLAMTDKELARRIALILTRADTEAAVDGCSGVVRHVLRSAGSEGTTRGFVSPPGTSAPSPSRHGNAGNGADKGGGGPRANSGARISTQPPQSEISSEIFQKSKPPRPKVGEQATIGKYEFDKDSEVWFPPVTIQNAGPVRDGPDIFVVLHEGLRVKEGGDYAGLLAWARAKYKITSLAVTVEAIRPDHLEPERPDQRETGPRRPTVQRGHERQRKY